MDGGDPQFLMKPPQLEPEILGGSDVQAAQGLV